MLPFCFKRDRLNQVREDETKTKGRRRQIRKILKNPIAYDLREAKTVLSKKSLYLRQQKTEANDWWEVAIEMSNFEMYCL